MADIQRETLHQIENMHQIEWCPVQEIIMLNIVSNVSAHYRLQDGKMSLEVSEY